MFQEAVLFLNASLESGVRSQESGVWSQESGVWSQESEAREPAAADPRIDTGL